jgi:membrane-bound lytic murein transglycosylase F
MGGRVLVLFLMSALVLSGCTPVDQSLVKRADQSVEEPPKYASEVKPVEEDTENALDPALKEFIQEHGALIKRQAAKSGFDWRLILAIVKQESGYCPDALSGKGASGLMQLMPMTGEEVARSLALEDFSHPENNIRGGIYYFRTLYDLFQGVEEPDRTKLALAAYNAGIGRIYDAQEVAAYLHENPTRWQSIKDALPLLSKRFYTLHRNVWDQEKPRSGWFGSSRETVAYVDNIMQTYDEFRLILN